MAAQAHNPSTVKTVTKLRVQEQAEELIKIVFKQNEKKTKKQTKEDIWK